MTLGSGSTNKRPKSTSAEASTALLARLFGLPLTLAVVYLMTALLSSSCALFNPLSGTSAVPLVTTCNIPTDESGTISGHWATEPIPIAFHQGDFVSAEMLDMTNSADTWNTFFNASKSLTIYNYGGNNASPTTSAATDTSQTGSLCAQSIIQGTNFTGNIVIYKLGTWPSSYAASAIALTTFCTVTATPYPTMYMAVMEINYQSFFVTGQKVPDLQSIILHELGHAMGLKHTCEAGSTLTGMPDCNEANLDPDYVAASMYPVFTFDSSGNGQQKRVLQTNDQSRANCLY